MLCLLAPGKMSTTKQEATPETLEYNFVKTLDAKYMCTICTGLLKDPHLTECCGHHFCEKCLQKWHTSTKEVEAQRKKCPHCRKASFGHIHNKSLLREISELSVYCCSKSRGCEWTGQLSEHDQHLTTCDFVQTNCEKCKKQIVKKDMAAHLEGSCEWREVACPHCHQTGPHREVTSLSHMFSCAGYPIMCPNGCRQEPFPRSQLNIHLEACPKAFVECPFREAGCMSYIRREAIQSHLASSQSLHLMVILGTVKKQSAEIKMLTRFKQKMEASMEEVTAEFDKLLQQSKTPQAVSISHSQLFAIRESLRDYPMLWLSPENSQITFSVGEKSRPFYVNDGYKFSIRIKRGTEKHTVIVSIHPGEFDDKIRWPPAVDLKRIVMRSTQFLFYFDSAIVNPLPIRKPSDIVNICKYVKRFNPEAQGTRPIAKAPWKSSEDIDVTLVYTNLKITADENLVSDMTRLTVQNRECENMFQSSTSQPSTHRHIIRVVNRARRRSPRK